MTRLHCSRMLPIVVLGIGLLCAGSARAGELKEAEAALRAGHYDDAIRALRAGVARAGSQARAHSLLVRALSEVGRYEEAEAAAREFAATHPGSAELSNSLGEALYARGTVQEAEAAFADAIARGAPDALRARANLAVLHRESGRQDDARKEAGALVDAYNEGGARSSEDLMAVAIACRLLGAEDPQLFKDALKAFDEAIARDPDNDEARVLLGELFLDKYNAPEAEASFKAVLEKNPQHPRALLGMARRHEFEGDDKALELVRKSLEVSPRLGAARAFLGRLLLDLEDYEGAAAEASRALEVNPVDLDALAVLAAARYLTGDTADFEEARRRALARNPKAADLLSDVAEACVRNRFYRQAVDLAGQAVALDPRSSRALGVLGLNELRLGEMDSGRRHLEAAFKGDPYNVWFKNTLDLLDTLPDYKETGNERLRFVVEGKEAGLLSPYLLELGEEALDKLGQRYGYRPSGPLRVEVYRSHADFAVRTVGLAEIGALGVCFGSVLALDSPSAREAGAFNWGSTLWHELAHVITLGLTDHRVPRWLTEGISVYEERRARPGWGDDATLPFLVAHKQGRLLPLAELNNGFVRPRYPQQVPVSYYQASLIVELIERERGFPALLALLREYKDGSSTREAFRKVLGLEPQDVDRRLKTFVDDRFRSALASIRLPAGPGGLGALGRDELEARGRDPGDFYGQLKRGQALFAEKRYDEAAPCLERAQALFPEYVEGDSPYWLLARIHEEKGERDKAVAELKALTAIDETHYQGHLKLAALQETAGDSSGAAATLERALYIHPYDPSLHARLAALVSGLGDKKKAVRERAAIVALDPVDRPSALYELARARLDAGDIAGARRDVLSALEAAPRFEKAQELLLRLPRSPRARAAEERP